MNKLIAGFAITFFLLSILSGIMDGQAGALAATELTANETAVDATINVTSTEGFLAAGGVLMIGDEKIEYTGVTAVTFTGCDRGYEGTEASSHNSGDNVYNEDAGVLNYALGFKIVETSATGGMLSGLTIAKNFMFITAPKLIMWDYSFFTGDLLVVRYALQTLSIGFVIYLGYTLGMMIFTMIRKLFPF